MGEVRTVDYNCRTPTCLFNGGTCTGIRFIPDPTIPLSAIPLGAQVSLALEVRREIKALLKDRAPNKYLTSASVRQDIVEARAKFAEAVKGGGVFAPPRPGN